MDLSRYCTHIFIFFSFLDIFYEQCDIYNKKRDMNDYFVENEKKDLQMLYEFNYQVKLFDSITPTKEKSNIDATAKRKNREFAIELKHRFINLEKYQTIMIEDYKLAEMMLEYTVNHKEPLYVNFLADGYILIFNLAKLSEKPRMRIQNIKSEGYDKMQCQERRYLLPIEEAAIYKDNNLVKPVGKQCQTKQYS